MSIFTNWIFEFTPFIIKNTKWLLYRYIIVVVPCPEGVLLPFWHVELDDVIILSMHEMRSEIYLSGCTSDTWVARSMSKTVHMLLTSQSLSLCKTRRQRKTFKNILSDDN